jgi:hypothetical protein
MYHVCKPIFSTFPPLSTRETGNANVMVKFSGSDSFIGFLDLKNVGVEPKIVSLSRSQADISLFEGFQLSAFHPSGVKLFIQC